MDDDWNSYRVEVLTDSPTIMCCNLHLCKHKKWITCSRQRPAFSQRLECIKPDPATYKKPKAKDAYTTWDANIFDQKGCSLQSECASSQCINTTNKPMLLPLTNLCFLGRQSNSSPAQQLALLARPASQSWTKYWLALISMHWKD